QGRPGAAAAGRRKAQEETAFAAPGNAAARPVRARTGKKPRAVSPPLSRAVCRYRLVAGATLTRLADARHPLPQCGRGVLLLRKRKTGHILFPLPHCGRGWRAHASRVRVEPATQMSQLAAMSPGGRPNPLLYFR